MRTTLLPEPTPAQVLAYKKTKLAELMKKAGCLTTLSTLHIRKMEQAEVERGILKYEELLASQNKAA